MSYKDDLRKLKKATERNKRLKPAQNLWCCACPGNIPRKPAVMTRFGPRCEEHKPSDPMETL